MIFGNSFKANVFISSFIPLCSWSWHLKRSLEKPQTLQTTRFVSLPRESKLLKSVPIVCHRAAPWKNSSLMSLRSDIKLMPGEFSLMSVAAYMLFCGHKLVCCLYADIPELQSIC